eukprot:jgi/Mesen1/6380/ME000329S05546
MAAAPGPSDGLLSSPLLSPTRVTVGPDSSESAQLAVEQLPDNLDMRMEDDEGEGSLTRSLSLSKLNAKAPAFVPKHAGVLGPAAAATQPTPSTAPQLASAAPPLINQTPAQGPLIAQTPGILSFLPVLPSPSGAVRNMSYGVPTSGSFPPQVHPDQFLSSSVARQQQQQQQKQKKGHGKGSQPHESHSKGGQQHDAQQAKAIDLPARQRNANQQPGHQGSPSKGRQHQDASSDQGHHLEISDMRDVKAKLMKQVEFYFSDQNLPTDNYLMKFLKKDPEGFVPLAVIAGFKKVKVLAPKNSSAPSIVSLLTTALRSSSQLVVSDDGKRVRRAQPMVEFDIAETQSRMVVAENLPADHSIQAMEKLFAQVGRVKMVRVCQPDAANGANQSASSNPKSPLRVSNKLHAMVEYETQEAAERAVKELTDEGNWRSGLHVCMLVRRNYGKQSSSSSQTSKPRKSPGGGGLGQQLQQQHQDSDAEDADSPASGTDADGAHAAAADGDDGGEGEGSLGARKGRAIRGPRGKGRGRGNTPTNTPPRYSPLSSSPLGGSYLESYMKPPPGPRMPDGTRGFTMGRGKAMSQATPQAGNA